MDVAAGKLARICLDLQEFTFSVEYKPGKEMFVDALSRLVGQVPEGKGLSSMVNLVHILDISPVLNLADLLKEQKTDTLCKYMYLRLSEDVPLPREYCIFERSIESFCLENGLVCFLSSPSASYRDEISAVPVVPVSFVIKVLNIFHKLSGHFGISKKLHKTKSTVWIPKTYS
jgi:hypothetical protein